MACRGHRMQQGMQQSDQDGSRRSGSATRSWQRRATHCSPNTGSPGHAHVPCTLHPAPRILHPASRTHPSKGAPVVALVDVRHRVHALRQRWHLRVQHTLALQHCVRAAAGRGAAAAGRCVYGLNQVAKAQLQAGTRGTLPRPGFIRCGSAGALAPSCTHTAAVCMRTSTPCMDAPTACNTSMQAATSQCMHRCTCLHPPSAPRAGSRSRPRAAPQTPESTSGSPRTPHLQYKQYRGSTLAVYQYSLSKAQPSSICSYKSSTQSRRGRTYSTHASAAQHPRRSRAAQHPRRSRAAQHPPVCA